MNAHQLGANNVILNTIVVDSLDMFPNLIDASVGGNIGDTWNGTEIIKKPPEPTPAPAPTKEQLMAQLAALSAQIQALE
jgi:hypothetical protein